VKEAKKKEKEAKEKKEEEKKAESEKKEEKKEEPNFEILQNPARVMRQQVILFQSLKKHLIELCLLFSSSKFCRCLREPTMSQSRI